MDFHVLYILQISFLKLLLSSRVVTISSFNDDLEKIVNSNDKKTQFQLMSLSNIKDGPHVQ